MTALIIILVILVALVGFGIIGFNKLRTTDIGAQEALGGIDVQLTRRADLIPNLVETVKGYATHEREVLENVTRARAMAASATGSPAEQAAAEGPLVAALRQLMLVVENYPDLKANQNFLQLQGELTNTEDRLQTARRFYNANVRDFNRRVKQFPSMIVASLFGFKEEEFFEVEDAIREGGPPQVNFGAPAGAGAPLAGAAPGAATDVTSTPAAPPPPVDDVPEPPGQPRPPTPPG
jgi:LemA protein